MIDVRIEAVDALDFRMGGETWDFARLRAGDIAEHWAKRLAAQPAMFNGRVLMLGPHNYIGQDGRRTLRGQFLETDFGRISRVARIRLSRLQRLHGFAMAVLRDSDGAFLLGEMSLRTASAGAIYFPAGTPDPGDVFGDVVDLDASVRRELREETGLEADEVEIASGWDVVHGEGRVACMKPMRLRGSAADAKAEIDARLAADPGSELARMHVVAGEEDFRPAMPYFVRAYMAHVFARERR